MSKVSLATLLTAIAMIIVATYLEMAFVAGGSGVVFVVGLTYAYVVARREVDQGTASDAVPAESA